MDSSSFDRLSRALAATPSRRGALGLLTGAITALLTRRNGEEAHAQDRTCRPLGKPCFPERGLDCCHGACRDGRCRCPDGARPCRGRCLSKRRCCRNADCPGGRVCRQGRCQCPAGKRRCGNRCIAATACCRHGECGAGGQCGNGRCQCAPGFRPCNGTCIAIADCCGGCADDQNCINGVCEPKRCGTGAPCRVFFTSTPYLGDLREGGTGSGIAGADAKCQARANVSVRTQGGTYKAWISDSTPASAPAQRFTNTANTGPYVLVDDAATVVATTWADLTDGMLLAPINVTELGVAQTNTVWTHTQPNGNPGGLQNVHCQAWTSASASDEGDVGVAIFADAQWTAAGTIGCNGSPSSLYCFEQG